MTGGEGQRLAEIRAREQAATPGPWGQWPEGTEESVESLSIGRFVCHLNSNMQHFRADSAFIAHSREDVPYLLDLVDALSSQVARAEGHLRCIPFETHEVEAAIRQHEQSECEGACMTAAAGREVLRLRQPQSAEEVEPHPYDRACRNTQHSGCTCMHLVNGRWCGKPRFDPIHGQAGEGRA